MLNQFRSLLVLSIGAVMMLVHSFVPHHHHNGETCFIETHRVCCNHYGSSASNGNTKSSGHTHEHSCNLLNEVSKADEIRIDKIIKLTSAHPHNLLAIACSEPKTFPLFILNTLQFWDVTHYWSYFISEGIPLRAPPF